MTEDKDLVSVEQWRGMNRGREDMRLTSADTNSAPSVLKPCPLCEGEAIKQVVENELGDHCCAISCGHCGLRGPLKLLEKSYAEAIAAWNRRASDPIRAELLEALKAMGFGKERYEENVGWHGSLDEKGKTLERGSPMYHCEFCHQGALDYTLLKHAGNCSVTLARAAITRAEME